MYRCVFESAAKAAERERECKIHHANSIQKNTSSIIDADDVKFRCLFSSMTTRCQGYVSDGTDIGRQARCATLWRLLSLHLSTVEAQVDRAPSFGGARRTPLHPALHCSELLQFPLNLLLPTSIRLVVLGVFKGVYDTCGQSALIFLRCASASGITVHIR